MSVQELILNDNPISIKVTMASNIEGTVIFNINAPHAKMIVCLDRNQAHLLMLYLQEHLNNDKISEKLDELIQEELRHKPKDIIQ